MAQVSQVFGAGRQAISMAVGALTFRYDGTGIAGPGSGGLPSFEYSGFVYGLTYANAAARGGLAAGLQPAEGADTNLRLIDAWLISSGYQLRGRYQQGKTHLRIPLVLAATYRHAKLLDVPGSLTFSTSSVGLGLGATLNGQTGDRLHWRLDVHPAAGLVTSSQTDAVGLGYLAHAEATAKLANIKGRFGFAVGYTLRYQVWNNRGSRRLGEIPDELYDYRGLMHALSAGLTF